MAVVTTPTDAVPRGRHPRGALRRPDEGARRGLGAGVRADHRRHRPRRADAGAAGVVRALVRCADLDGLGHREHGLGGRGAQADRGVHPGRRRDQRRRRRHQRGRAAVLERRGDDAHAHQGHPGHDPRQRHGADREAVARLLGRRLGRGQLRHRRLRPGDGPERPGAVLGPQPPGRARRADGALRAHVRPPRGGRSPPGRDDGPARPRHHAVPAQRSGQRLPDGGRDLLDAPATPSARRRSTSAPSCGRWPTRTTPRWSAGPAWPTRTPRS